MLAENLKNNSTSRVYLQETLSQVQKKITPVWPLADYVAVNPLAGFSHSNFMETASQLTSIAAIDLLMPMDYYRLRYRDGKLSRECINTALDEMVADGVEGVESLNVNQILSVLHASLDGNLYTETTDRHRAGTGRELKTLSDYIDQFCGAEWTQEIGDEVSKHCASYYDAGQATWADTEASESLYDSWRRTAQVDRSFELLGVRGFRDFVAKLPIHPEVALMFLLEQLNVPQSVWYDLLLCEAFKLPGWSAWTRYQDQKIQQAGGAGNDFVGLLAMRLAYQLAVSKKLDFSVNWQSLADCSLGLSPHSNEANSDSLIRYTLLKAEEISVRQRLLSGINSDHPGDGDCPRPLCQMVFCIDVRSERIRRHLESSSRAIQTFGFAGFFGLPIEMVPVGEEQRHACVPILLTPQFRVKEELDVAADSIQRSTSQGRQVRRQLRNLWQDFQAGATSCFSFVESVGLSYAAKLIAKSLGYRTESLRRFDGIAKEHQAALGPSLSGLEEQGMTSAKLIDLAESILNGIGIVNDFARLVVFCGHGSCGENNPLQAGLDCGACGGHTGEANARLAAKLLNQSFVRQGLAARGVAIPHDTHFLAALHNTTTDELKYFDLHLLPDTHQQDLVDLKFLGSKASKLTLAERLPGLSSNSLPDLLKRSRDWSEVRQEWGLAGNAAFIAGPREWTKSMTLDGRVFLHSYHHARDTEFKVLEQIMTAPMIVAHWINMQYYASTVAPTHFGSGTKTIHNVVGKFGLLSGNGGDLMTGLPWQSLHDGQRYQHEPLRLLAIVAAPREAISQILAKNSAVRDTLRNDWMQLVAVEKAGTYRYTPGGDWEELGVSQESSQAVERLIPQ